MSRIYLVMTLAIGLLLGMKSRVAGDLFDNTGANRFQDDVVAPAAVGLGACCNVSTQTCVDNVPSLSCTASDEVFEAGRSCCEAECIAPGEEYAFSGVELLSRVPLQSFPGPSGEMNDCWGYVSPSGREYAILGLDRTTGFVNITDPFNPVIVADIADAFSHWSDVKVYGEYAYNSTEAGGGIQIFDLRQSDQGVVTLVGALTASGLQTSHTITVNPASGYLYLNRTNIAGGGLVVVDLADPAAPAIVGAWTEQRLHDSQVVSYTSGPYAGREIAFCYCGNAGLFIVDVTDKSNMFTLSSVTYPDMTFCHQGWLTDDRRHVLINDEQDELAFGFPARTYIVNVEDLENPFFVEFYSNGKCTVDHDLIIDGPLVYKVNDSNGFRVDHLGGYAARGPATSGGPPFEVAFFDTYPAGNVVDYVGAWGVYAGFPSGVAIVSDRERGLFVLSFDCNRNQIDDTDDIASSTSQDCNGNGLPDECERDACGPTGPVVGDDTCQTAGADLGTPCRSHSDCPVPGSACGNKNRYISFGPINAAIAGGASIQVEVLSMPQFPSMVGDIYYAGPEQSIPNSPNAALRGAPLQCTAHAQTWTTGLLHVFGAIIVPGSTYGVRMCDPSGVQCDGELLVATAKWGDVVRPFGGVSQPNFGDINSIVQKFSNLASAPSMARADLVGAGNPGAANTPNQVANFADISSDVSAFSGFPYPYTVPACP